VSVAVALSVSGTDVFAGMTVCCVAQAVMKRAIFTKTNKVFFITELLSYLRKQQETVYYRLLLTQFA
jgi:hypothetical protein